MNVLSLFDGMSCGQLALQKAGIKYDGYYASEINKHAIKVTQHHFPNTIQLGDIRTVRAADLPRIDLLFGGSPCKGFSNAGTGLNFKHPESKLFFEWVRLWKETNPKYFLLENVKMKREWENVITKILGVRPIRLDSGLVTAQVRKRLYWTNIPVITIPNNKRLTLADIIEDGVTLRGEIFHNIITHSLQPRTGKGNGGKGPLKKQDGKSYCLDTGNGQAIEYNGERRKLTVKECCRLQTVPDEYFKDIVSDTQAFIMLGNGWTVDIVAHILSFIPQLKKATS